MVRKKVVKPEKASPEAFFHSSRVTKLVTRKAAHVGGSSARQSLDKIAELVNTTIPSDEKRGKDLLRMFKRGADQSLRLKLPVGNLHCAEKSNLTIALLRARGRKAWLVRQMIFNEQKQEWRFHDFVETTIEGKVYTMIYHTVHGLDDQIAIGEGAVNIHINKGGGYLLRGADTQNIGGVGNWKEYESFRKRFAKNPAAEIERNRKRINLLAKKGIIPKEVVGELKNVPGV